MRRKLVGHTLASIAQHGLPNLTVDDGTEANACRASPLQARCSAPGAPFHALSLLEDSSWRLQRRGPLRIITELPFSHSRPTLDNSALDIRQRTSRIHGLLALIHASRPHSFPKYQNSRPIPFLRRPAGVPSCAPRSKDGAFRHQLRQPSATAGYVV